MCGYARHVRNKNIGILAPPTLDRSGLKVGIVGPPTLDHSGLKVGIVGTPSLDHSGLSHSYSSYFFHLGSFAFCIYTSLVLILTFAYVHVSLCFYFG